MPISFAYRLLVDYFEDKMWLLDPVDLWAAVIIFPVYSLPFLALIIEFKLRELKQRAMERDIQKALLRRLTGQD